ncbi:MAG: UDP-N-acetylglucosamine 1-carboxyvinyltransferase [Candidatus Omnitrophica bacterium]|nr:UDP-N-acetylglucosamine 1-carboxyvinyltransferase [Candidatus Omnitrophota bacterium]
MDKLVIEGGVKLEGKVEVSGAKNAFLPILAATLLTDEVCKIHSSPKLKDVQTMIKIIEYLGKRVDFQNGTVVVKPRKELNSLAPYKLVSTMRASFCVLGPLVARLKHAKVSLPGGCIIGVRPVDLHLKGLIGLGVDINIDSGYVIASAKNNHLRGNRIYLGGEFGPSVTATANIMMAATLARGSTIIEAAACEPEISDLAEFLIKMGAKIKGAGTPIIKIDGVDKLGGAEHTVIPDRIEAGTFMVAAAITKGDILIKNCVAEHLGAIIDVLIRAGVEIKARDNELRVKSIRNTKAINVTTFPYPGFPTDMQAQTMSLMSVTSGISIIHEKVYPDRFMHVAELNRMGAHIQREGPYAVVHGVKRLSGASLMACDLRASAALVLAALVSEGKSTISRIYHLDRGYEKLDLKLQNLGAKIWREKE